MLGAAFNLLIWLVGLFHKSSADKLAALKVKSATDDSIIKSLEAKNAIQSDITQLSDDELARRLHSTIRE